MPQRLATTVSRSGAPLPELLPLVLAIMAAFPAPGRAAATVVRPATPAPRTVPVPAASGWTVSTSTANAPSTIVNTSNAAGGYNQTINQTSTSAVYNWQSFDIGSASSVTFNYPTAGSSSLNRVVGSTAPSAIFGKLTSQYANPVAGGAPLVGGSIYLINANGILFGKGAQVNTGALIASTLDLQDADFYSGMTQSITSQAYTFGAFTGSLVPTAPNDFVLVDPGAQITTPSGGRVFLFAKDVVQNAGTITTPNGQTALGAGDQVYLNVPTNEVMYASEVNASIPAVNGLLVEVGTGAGSVANLQGGVINTPTGNTTLVGMAVNQSGRINATTSVSQNGSVFLLARGDAVASLSPSGGLVLKEATQGGTLTLGPGVTVNGVANGVVDIEPDTTVDAKGQQATSNANSIFTPSLVVLDGADVELQKGARIVAHGGVVDVRAETTPYYVPTGTTAPAYDYAAMTGDGARLVLDADATIDVSGTTNTTVSAARNFVTTALLGANDLADAPLQRDGPVYRSELTFDVRSPVPILGDTSAYLNAIEKTATEQLAAGGTIKLSSTGAVVTNPSSVLNVSGGAVTYTSAVVTPSELLGANGSVYTFNQAPADIAYTAILGAPTGTLDRWGVVPAYAPSQAVVTPGYVAGQAGGTLSVVSPLSVLDGQIQAQVTQGVRQTAGLDALAAASRLVLGARTNGADSFGTNGFISAGLGALDINAAAGAIDSSFWSDPLAASATLLPATSRIAASTLNASGLGQVSVTSNEGITLAANANLVLPTSGVVDLAAGGAGGIDLAADITSAGGTISAQTRGLSGTLSTEVGSVTLASGARLDVSAAWVNRALDGATAQAATAGGSVTLSSGAGLDVQDASTIDVSGGATVGTNRKVAGTAAGSVTLQSGMSGAGTPSPIHLGSRLVANSLGGGGKLKLQADQVTIGAGAIPSGVADGQAVGSLVLSSQFFDQGAFTSYEVDAFSSLTVASGVALRPQASNWILTAAAANQPTGTKPSSFMGIGELPDAQRAPVSVSLSAASATDISGRLTMSAGSSIITDPLASVTLNAGLELEVDGEIVAPGGDVALDLGAAISANAATGWFRLGASSSVDVSGVTVMQVQTGLFPTGQVLAGGQVTLDVATDVSTTPIVMLPGSVIAADGTSAVLGVTTTNAAGSTSVAAQTVASAGGSVTIDAKGGAALAGTMHALGGDSSVSGGAFDLSGASTLVVQQSAVTDATPVSGVVAVSAQSLAQGFSDASLQAVNQIHFSSAVDLAMSGNLTIDAPVLSVSPGAGSVALSGASTLSVGAGFQISPSGAGAIGGAASLSLDGGLVELFGQQVAQGFGSVSIAAGSELRLESLVGSGSPQGDLAVQGALTLSAPLIAPTTNSQYTFDAAGQQVLITGGDSKAAVPLTAGGGITINAADITTVDPSNPGQYGVLRAPFGSITLNATDSITLGPGSVLSVSGAGMTVPYGQTLGGQDWSYGGQTQTVAAPPQKSITLSAPGSAIDVQSGATLDLSGGGNLVAREFVPGNGGTKDIFAGAANGAFAIVPSSSAYAAQDRDILTAQKDASGNSAALTLGRDITFGAGGPIPAGTYVVLPAEYATLAGAFLVTPTSSSAPLALGASVRQTDGSVLMGGRFVEAGTGFGSSLTQTFKVLTSTQALAYSEIDQANANTYFTSQANAAGTAVPALPTDAGTLNIAAAQLSLKGSTLFTLPTVTTTTGSTTTTTTVGRGGELDISANDIQVGGTAASGVLSLSADDLNATGAALIVLGGHLDTASGELDVAANSVTVDSAAAALSVNDLVLVANNAVTVKAGSSITAPAQAAGAATVAAPALDLSGDGAMLRVSTDAAATSTRTGVQGAAGTLDIGAGVKLAGGAITADGTLTNTIAGDATLSAQAITLAAGHMAVGDGAAATAAADTLVLTPALAAQVAGAQSLTLRSATGLDLLGAVTLGGAALRSLTVDTGTISLVGDGQAATIEAGGVTLMNSSGQAGTAVAGSNTLQVDALGSGTVAGTGQVLFGAGSLAVAGAGQTTVSATHEAVLGDGAAFDAGGGLTVNAASLQAARAANATLAAGGSFTLTSAGTASGTAAGPGAQVAITAQSIVQDGQLVLPSGQLALTASGTGAGATAIRFGSGSLTDLSGRSSQIDSITVSTPGGTLDVTAASGNVSVDTGATLNVSAPSTGAHAGSITISAPTGSVALQGSLLGTAATGQGGGSLSVDSASALDLAALAATINAQANNFTGSLDLRNRVGDQTLAAGTSLTAGRIELGADTGTLRIDGSLNATAAAGASVTLAGGQALEIDAGSTVAAHSSGTTGAQVSLLSGDRQLQSDGSFTGDTGSVDFNGGVIDTTAATGGTNGTVLVRAQRSADGTDMAIGGSGGTTVRGASQVQVEAVRQYAASTVDSALIAQVNADNQVLGANTSAVLARVGALTGSPAATQLRAGVEVDSTGDLTMAGNTAAGGWNLTQFAANGSVQAQATGAPMDLTLRAAGNLFVTGSISDGFMPSGNLPTTAAAAGKITPSAVIAQVNGNYLQGANIALVGGADLGAADFMATNRSDAQGDVTIGADGKNVLVRSTTGNISIAAGRDVTLLNTLADVYTTGVPVTPTAYVPGVQGGYVGNLLGTATQVNNPAYINSNNVKQSPFLAGGGNLAVDAGRDIVGVDPNSTTVQYATEWAWRATDQKTDGQPMWWNRYDQFQQGFATFGGGDLTAVAQRDIVNANFSAAGSGYVSRNADGSVGAAVVFPAGDVSVQAGRDILGGFVLAEGASGDVQAGRDIVAGTAPDALQLVYGNTALNVGALDDVDLGLASSFGLVPATKEYLAVVPNLYILGLTPQASLQVQAVAGDLVYDSVSPLDSSLTRGSAPSTIADRIVPDVTSFTAPNGSIKAGQLIQDPAGTTSLQLLAFDNLVVSSIEVDGTDKRAATPTALVNSDFEALDRLNNYFSTPANPFDQGVRTPTELVAQNGDVTIEPVNGAAAGILTDTSLRLIAGRDIIMSGGNLFQGITLQSQGADELSLIQAGRDIEFAANGGVDGIGGVSFAGPGDLMVLAGRDIDLSTSGGVRAIGNRQNSAITTSASGSITMAAGVSTAAGDYAQASAWYFPLLGGTGIAGYASDLAAQLAALQAGLPLPAAGSAAAAQYAALPIASQVTQVKTLVGSAVFDAAVLADAQRRAGSTAVTLAQAQTSFTTLTATQQSAVLGAALANAWVAAVPVAEQRSQVIAFAQAAPSSTYLAQLTQFVAAEDGGAALDPVQALAAFEAMTPERQALLTNQVLVSVLRQAGRAATKLSGDAQTAAYAPAYAALDLVFPTVGTAGSIDLGASQIETLQDSAITVLAPHGSVDVGTTVAGPGQKSAQNLGIVTADGGNLSMIVGDSVNVDQSRVFTVGLGDLLMWASTGNLDAGRGGKTVVGAPTPVYRLDSQGNFVIDTSGSFSGSGIAVLDAASDLDLYAPKGAIDAGDAGIKAVGNAFFGAQVFLHGDALSVGGTSVGAPPPASTGGGTASMAAAAQNASAATQPNADDSEEEKERKRRKRLNLVLDFLGFGDPASKP